MRIIAGEHRGRRLEGPPGKGTRPMLDRVREAMFSKLGPWLEDGRVLDLFAGTGNLGLEALSRGAREVVMVETDVRTLALQRRNVEALGLAERVHSVRGDALEPRNWAVGGAETPAYDIVFLDPPYPMLREARTTRLVRGRVELLRSEWLANDGVLVLHTPPAKHTDLDWEELSPELREYGNSALWFVGGEGAA